MYPIQPSIERNRHADVMANPIEADRLRNLVLGFRVHGRARLSDANSKRYPQVGEQGLTQLGTEVI